MSKCFALPSKIGRDCANVVAGGYTGRGIYISADAISSGSVTVTDSGSAQLGSRIYGLVWASVNVLKEYAFPIENVNQDPLTGSTTAGNTDSGYPMFLKTVSVRVPKFSDVQSGNNVLKENSLYMVGSLMANSARGILLLERRTNDPIFKYELVGMESNAIIDPSSYSADEYANGGDATVNFVSTESYSFGTFQDGTEETDGKPSTFATMWSNLNE